MSQPPPPENDPAQHPEDEPTTVRPEVRGGSPAGAVADAGVDTGVDTGENERPGTGPTDPPLRAEPYLGGAESADPDVTGVQDPYRPQSERPADPTDPYATYQTGYQPGPDQQGAPGPYPPGPYPSGQGYQPVYYAGQSPMSDSDARLWATLAHVGVFITGFVGPLIIWAVFKDRSRLVRDNAAAATNFGILMTIGTVLGSILTVIFIGVVVLFAVWVLAIVCGILGAIKANRGEFYGYPFNVKWVK